MAVWMVASPCVRRCRACGLEKTIAGISAPRYRLRPTGGGSGNSTISEAWCGAGGRNDIWYLDCCVYPQPSGGAVQLRQMATGGAGGYSSSGAGGAAGSGTSSLTVSDTTAA